MTTEENIKTLAPNSSNADKESLSTKE